MIAQRYIFGLESPVLEGTGLEGVTAGDRCFIQPRIEGRNHQPMDAVVRSVTNFGCRVLAMDHGTVYEFPYNLRQGALRFEASLKDLSDYVVSKGSRLYDHALRALGARR